MTGVLARWAVLSGAAWKKRRFTLRGGRVSLKCRLPFRDPLPVTKAGFLVLRHRTAMNILQKIHREQMKSDLVDMNVGDTVKVHNRVVEGGKERIQIFAGIIIGKSGLSKSQSITVRKLSYGEGVERVYPIHSPLISKIEVTKRGQVRRAALNYLRNRVGKDAVTVKEAPRAK